MDLIEGTVEYLGGIMEETNGKEDLHGNGVRQISSRPVAGLKHTASGRSTPRNSPRRWRTAHRELRGSYWWFEWLGMNSLVSWLALIAVWAYIVFLVQSKWAAQNDGRGLEIGGHANNGEVEVRDAVDGAVVPVGNSGGFGGGDPVNLRDFKGSGSIRGGVSLVTRRPHNASGLDTSVVAGRGSAAKVGSGGNAYRGRKTVTGNNETGYIVDGVPKKNTLYGLLVGPFGKIEDSILGWTSRKTKGTCETDSNFAKFVRSRRFVLIFHELSMTGAPISMMELATEILSCGGSVSAVVLSWKGGLMTELNRRGIRVVRDRGRYSFRAANRADLIIAGSAVCSSWIEEYLSHFNFRSSRILWWIMENRREYFDRTKHLLNRVKVLMFLAELQTKQWLTWCEEEGIHLNTVPTIVPLSVNDELSFVAGIPCPLNDQSFTVEKMQEKRNTLRHVVRREMGLTDNDMLVMTLSSINPGKGQYHILESVVLMFEQIHPIVDIRNSSLTYVKTETSSGLQESEQRIQRSSEKADQIMDASDDDLTRTDNVNVTYSKRRRRRTVHGASSGNFSGVLRRKDQHVTRNLLSNNEIRGLQTLKVLIGSVGSKSNKVPYVKEILNFLSRYRNLSKYLLWTPATTHVSSLYAAADVYVINAQGIGETFGRVTIEAMAFGLPVLGTDAGGTKEIVEDKVTGLLHPVGAEGAPILAQNLQFLLSNSSAREQLGRNGRSKVEKTYMKHHMYDKLAMVFAKSLKQG